MHAAYRYARLYGFFKAMCNASLMCYTIRFFKELGSEWKNLNQRCVDKMG